LQVPVADAAACISPGPPGQAETQVRPLISQSAAGRGVGAKVKSNSTGGLAIGDGAEALPADALRGLETIEPIADVANRLYENSAPASAA
jgi:hypothetical protein